MNAEKGSTAQPSALQYLGSAIPPHPSPLPKEREEPASQPEAVPGSSKRIARYFGQHKINNGFDCRGRCAGESNAFRFFQWRLEFIERSCRWETAQLDWALDGNSRIRPTSGKCL